MHACTVTVDIVAHSPAGARGRASSLKIPYILLTRTRNSVSVLLSPPAGDEDGCVARAQHGCLGPPQWRRAALVGGDGDRNCHSKVHTHTHVRIVCAHRYCPSGCKAPRSLSADLCFATCTRAAKHPSSCLLTSVMCRCLCCVYSGHRAAVTMLRFVEGGASLVSGSNDTDVIMWDVVAEAGVVRLHGHSAPVTDCVHLSAHNLLITCSKDHQLKVSVAETTPATPLHVHARALQGLPTRAALVVCVLPPPAESSQQLFC